MSRKIETLEINLKGYGVKANIKKTTDSPFFPYGCVWGCNR